MWSLQTSPVARIFWHFTHFLGMCSFTLCFCKSLLVVVFTSHWSHWNPSSSPLCCFLTWFFTDFIFAKIFKQYSHTCSIKVEWFFSMWICSHFSVLNIFWHFLLFKQGNLCKIKFLKTLKHIMFFWGSPNHPKKNISVPAAPVTSPRCLLPRPRPHGRQSARHFARPVCSALLEKILLIFLCCLILPVLLRDGQFPPVSPGFPTPKRESHIYFCWKDLLVVVHFCMCFPMFWKDSHKCDSGKPIYCPVIASNKEHQS